MAKKIKVAVPESEAQLEVREEPTLRDENAPDCEACKGVGVNMSLDSTVLCAVCNGSGQVKE